MTPLRRASSSLVLACALLALQACSDRSESADPTRADSPFPVLQTIGSAGNLPGQFQYPRALAADPRARLLYVIDKMTGRVQSFNADTGRLAAWWLMPKSDRGKPTGCSVAPDGSLYVADTHENRIMVFAPDGRLIRSFGSYGLGPGQFTYPTDVAFGPDDTYYISEFGGNDRIQVFDAAGNFLFSFGSFGPETGQFNRPQSMEFTPDGRELWIADACNHRIVITDPQGNWITTFGRAGTGPGELSYPYSLILLPDGSALITEFGNNRIQRLARDGTSLGIIGRTGSAPGELRCPWGLAALDDRAFVIDAGNNRIEAFALPK